MPALTSSVVHVLEPIHPYRLYELIVILHTHPDGLFIIESIACVFAANAGLDALNTLVRLIE